MSRLKIGVILLLAFVAAHGLPGTAFGATSPTLFSSLTPPPAPDYAQPQSWAARPGHEGAAAAVAPNATPAATQPKVDVFYVNPTTYRNLEVWNQDFADKVANEWTDQSVIARQAGIFNGCCRVFAPRYRQASLLGARNLEGEGAKAFDLAYGDVRRAFDYYLAHYNGGRPFILVGHSQGAFHVARLLSDEIDGKPLASRMVAAYDIGYVLTVGDFGKTYKTLRICDTPSQTGCVISWNSVIPAGATPAFRSHLEQHYVQHYGDDAGKTLLCINPLTFDRARPDGTMQDSLGAAPGDPGFGPVRALVPHAVSARCVQGLLIVQPVASLGLKPLPNGFMHYHDFGMFYADIRANAELRCAAFLKAHPAAP
jgi:hypothetical protein